MTIAATHLGSEHLARAVQITTQLAALPAIATLDWCERAAAALLPLHARSMVSVTIAQSQHMPQGLMLTDFECEGAVDGTAAPGRKPGAGVDLDIFRGADASLLGWALPHLPAGEHGAPRIGLLREVADASGWAATAAGKRYHSAGLHDLLVAVVKLGGENIGRVLAVEVAVRPNDPHLNTADAALLAAVLPTLAARALSAFGASPLNPNHRITPREQEVLEQLALGKTVKQIATDLDRSPHTVHDHVKSLHRKLNASSRGELVARVLGHIDACTLRDTRPKSRRGGPHDQPAPRAGGNARPAAAGR
ncbi:MAG: helix-turn-helix transcriptional regulator [Phycisphaerales bacterium]|nr:helix-turn-helix transcriptional regulator [Phycisphaerales bacterium]